MTMGGVSAVLAQLVVCLCFFFVQTNSIFGFFLTLFL
jgi:hypothetical protein